MSNADSFAWPALWNVLFFLFNLAGIAMLFVGIALLIYTEVQAWWTKPPTDPKSKPPPTDEKAKSPSIGTAPEPSSAAEPPRSIAWKIRTWAKELPSEKQRRYTGLTKGGAMAAGGAVFLALGLTLPKYMHEALDMSSGAEGLTGVGAAAGDVITAIIAATSVIAVLLLRKAVNEQVKQLKASAVQNVGHEMLKIDRWMADHQPHYLDALKLQKTDESPVGSAVAEVYADFIDQVVSQEEYLPKDHPELWYAYFKHLIETWPQLRKFMEDNPEWYLETMNGLLYPDGVPPEPAKVDTPAGSSQRNEGNGPR